MWGIDDIYSKGSLCFKKVPVPDKLLEIEINENIITDALKDAAERFLTIEEVNNAITAGDIISTDLESCIAKFNRQRFQISVGRGYFNKVLEVILPVSLKIIMRIDL